MDELIGRIGKAKAAIDYGFSRVGPQLRADHEVEGSLLRLANRMLRLSNAAVLLCKNNHSNEAAPLLCFLLETAWTMRWIATPLNKGKKISELEAQFIGVPWGNLGADPRCKNLMVSTGVSAKDFDAAQTILSGQLEAYRGANGATIPWAHVFPEDKGAATSPESILGFVVTSMVHALNALDLFWPGVFPTPGDKAC